MAAAKEFNIGTQTLIEFLVSKSFPADELKPTSKLTPEMYRVLQAEFQQDKAAKQKAEQVDLPRGSAEQKKKKDEEDLSFKKKDEKAPIAEKKAAETAAVVEEKKAEPEIAKVDVPEIEGPKILDKIDLSAINSSTRPKKGAKKKEEKKEEKKIGRAHV